MIKTVIISAVNLVEGGAFTILLDCLKCLSNSTLINDFRFVVLVNSICRMPKYEGVEYLEFPKAKKHYIYRLYYEFFKFKKVSQLYRPVLWLSLHDMSPRVEADTQAVYMHNPTPFYKPKWHDWKYVPINAIWAYLYKYLYRINIRSNAYLIVQQDWLRKEFSEMFSFPKDRIIVSKPSSPTINFLSSDASHLRETESFVFFYPAYPRVFKNFDVICEAAEILEKEKVGEIRIVLTIDGTENGYSKNLVARYSHNSLIDFKGLVPQSEMNSYYADTDCLIFPSRLETWGLPLSEFKVFDRPMLVADLPYAHESVAGALKVCFFNPDSANDLANAMKAIAKGKSSLFKPVKEQSIGKPFSTSWEELFDILLKTR